MLKAIFTLDYEIHGNGDGNPYRLMVEPTERMMRQFDKYGAKLTIMADIAEILKFKQYAEEQGRDDYSYEAIVQQLRSAVQRGHDVQLHIHSSYFNAVHQHGRWLQDWTEYDFARLDRDRMNEMVSNGKDFLETLLCPVDKNYRCTVFRAANWSVSPSHNVIKTLINNGIKIDTSVFKYGQRDGNVKFDYSSAHSPLVPWRADDDDICLQNDIGKLWEFPIYTEARWLGAFITMQRIYRAILGKFHKFEKTQDKQLNEQPPEQSEPKGNKERKSSGNWLTQKHAWKVDFNQCTGHQLISALQRAEKKYTTPGVEYPFVLIGHSKLYTGFNEFSLKPFLAYVANNPNRFSFGKFSDFHLDDNIRTWGNLA